MSTENKYDVKVVANAFYLPDQSDEEEDRYVFAYTITIRNEGSVPAKLNSRHGINTDSENRIQEVRGACRNINSL